MDIAPPPSDKQLKKRLKKQRHKRNQRNTQAVADIAAPPDPTDTLKAKFQKRIQGLEKRRSGEVQKEANDLRKELDLKHNSNLNVEQLLTKLGVVDAEQRKSLAAMMQSGGIRDLAGLMEHMPGR